MFFLNLFRPGMDASVASAHGIMACNWLWSCTFSTFFFSLRSSMTPFIPCLSHVYPHFIPNPMVQCLFPFKMFNHLGSFGGIRYDTHKQNRFSTQSTTLRSTLGSNHCHDSPGPRRALGAVAWSKTGES